MKVHAIFAYGVVASLYEADAGEGLPWHQHYIPHGHKVIRGRTRLEIEGRDAVEISAADHNRELPPITPHQITAIEDGTIFVNMMATAPHCVPAYQPPPPNGGVRLDDGTVVYE